MQNRELLLELAAEIVACERCPRLRAHCAEVARVKVHRYRDEAYWGRPVPGFGDPAARLLLIGLAPAAHGGNRTGRVFTGDESGDWVYEGLHRIGMASQPISRRRDDGTVLRGAYISAAARCAPPNNKPLPEELRNCRPFLERELALLTRLVVVLALGKIAFDTYVRILRDAGLLPARAAQALRFAHGAEYDLHRLARRARHTAGLPNHPDVGATARPAVGTLPVLLASYHPSRQNTYTKKLTREMWHAMFDRVRELVATRGTADAAGEGH